jgi:phosphoribosylamine--glycine ligase
MKVLVLGQGGREHAIIKALYQSPSISGIFAAPGNPGFSQEAAIVGLSTDDAEGITKFCHQNDISLVVIGPEEPLVRGLVDKLIERGILVVGPSAKGARLEGSKVFCKNFAIRAKIPTAAFEVVNSVSQALEAALRFNPPFVLKADGLAAGKGVHICKNADELKKSAELFFEKKIFGNTSAILEEFIAGEEVSVIVATNGKEFTPLPTAQDYKRLLDGQRGPNTGGMGAWAPVELHPHLDQKIKSKIIEPTVKSLDQDQIPYRGFLFFGVMVKDQEPYLLEINCRLGDPETQVILPLIDSDFGLWLKALSLGRVEPLRLRKLFATCVVMAAPGYPDQPQKGLRIQGEIQVGQANQYFLSAGVGLQRGHWVTQGGRVLNAVGLAANKEQSSRLAYAQVAKASWEGMQVRKDIGN